MRNIAELLNSLKSVTRVEFVPANSASVVIGFAWAASQPVSFTFQTVGFLVFLFVVLSAVGTLGAHWNTYSDFELDRDDPTKQELHRSLLALGKDTLMRIIRVEVVLAIIIFVLFYLTHGDPRLIALWLAAICLAYAYSMPPLRFKARGILAFVSLCMVLSILPVLFVYLSTNPHLSREFIIFLAGHTMVIYSLIIPTEIRDFVVDRDHQVTTMTVWLGLKEAIIFDLILLGLGTALILGGYFFSEIFHLTPVLRGFLVVPLLCNGLVFSKLIKLRKLINQPGKKDQAAIAEAARLAEDNPQWITISSMGSLVIAIVTIVGKVILM